MSKPVEALVLPHAQKSVQAAIFIDLVTKDPTGVNPTPKQIRDHLTDAVIAALTPEDYRTITEFLCAESLVTATAVLMSSVVPTPHAFEIVVDVVAKYPHMYPAFSSKEAEQPQLSYSNRIYIISKILDRHATTATTKTSPDDEWITPACSLCINAAMLKPTFNLTTATGIIEKLAAISVDHLSPNLATWKNLVLWLVREALATASIDRRLLLDIRVDTRSIGANLANLTFSHCIKALVTYLYVNDKIINADPYRLIEPPDFLLNILSMHPPENITDYAAISETYAPLILAEHRPVNSFIKLIDFMENVHVPEILLVHAVTTLFIHALHSFRDLQQRYCKAIIKLAASYAGSVDVSKTISIASKFIQFDSTIRLYLYACNSKTPNLFSNIEPINFEMEDPE